MFKCFTPRCVPPSRLSPTHSMICARTSCIFYTWVWLLYIRLEGWHHWLCSSLPSVFVFSRGKWNNLTLPHKLSVWCFHMCGHIIMTTIYIGFLERLRIMPLMWETWGMKSRLFLSDICSLGPLGNKHHIVIKPVPPHFFNAHEIILPPEAQ